MKDCDYLLGISTFPLMGVKRISLLREYFGSYKGIWEARRGDLLATKLSQKLTEGFLKARDGFDRGKYLSQMKREEVSFITIHDKRYPANLKDIEDVPLWLYIKGKLRKTDTFSLAIVGTRIPSSYGIRVTTEFIPHFIKKNITIVSGLAKGIDTVAARETIKNNGRTIAVLGSGLDNVYPYENKSLSESITKNGAIISEYPMSYPPLAENFPQRNRIISGLAKGVLVIEGRSKSGTIITARKAAEQGREVFAIPGNIYSHLSEASFLLIQNGATLVSCPDIVIELL